MFSRIAQLTSSFPDMERFNRYAVNQIAESSQLQDINLELKLFEGQASQVEPRNKFRDAASLPDKLDAARKLTNQINTATQLKKPLPPKSASFDTPRIGAEFPEDGLRAALEHVLTSTDLHYKDLFFCARGIYRLFHQHKDLWRVLESVLVREIKQRAVGGVHKAGVKYLYMALSLHLQCFGEENVALLTAFNRFMDVQYHTLDILSKWQICQTFLES